MTQSDIENTVCEYYGIDALNLYTKTRKIEFTFPRQLIMYLNMVYLKLSSTKSAKIYNRDHCTALHAKKTIKNEIETNKQRRLQVEEIIELLSKCKPSMEAIVINDVDLLELSKFYTKYYLKTA